MRAAEKHEASLAATHLHRASLLRVKLQPEGPELLLEVPHDLDVVGLPNTLRLII